MKLALVKPDSIGAMSSVLCVIHCLVTPFIFIVHECSLGGCKTSPVWWQNIDLVFLVISFYSIYHSTKTTSNHIIKLVLRGMFGLLFLLILNQKTGVLFISENVTHVVAILLAILHLYNLNYCQCTSDTCVSNKK